MISKLKKLLILILLLYIITITLLYKNNIFNIIYNTLNIWLFKIFPPIFIFYCITSLLISSKTIDIIFFILKPLRKIFKFETDNGFKLFIIAILVGNPSSSAFIISYLNNDNITLNDANTLNKCSSFITPLFIFSILPDIKIFLLIYSIHILSNIIICIYLTKNNTTFIRKTNPKVINFFDYINKLPQILFNIAIFMIVCNIIIYSLSLININPIYFSFIELGSGAINIMNCNSQYKYIIITSLLSFNGLCIHLQVYSIIKDSLSYLTFFKYRIIQTIISIILFLLVNAYFT